MIVIINWPVGYLSMGLKVSGGGESYSPIVADCPGPWASLSVSGPPHAWKTTKKMSTDQQYLG